jgi:hypothetical protein
MQRDRIIEASTVSRLRSFNAHIIGDTPISFSRHYDEISVPRLSTNESHDSYEARTWRFRLHWDLNTGQCFVPPTMIKESLTSTARFLNIKYERNQTYTKFFESGVLVTSPAMLFENVRDPRPIMYQEVKGETYFVPSDGKKGGSKRVNKTFPVIHNWNCDIEVTVSADQIKEEVFARVLTECGRFNGWGRFRPQKGGFYGRFRVENITMIDLI